MLRLLSILIFLLLGTNAFAAGMTEKEKIDALLKAFDTPDIIVVVNGKGHDGTWAKHLLKHQWKSAKKIKTAKQFITKIASNSPPSNGQQAPQPLIIKMRGGKTMKSADWLKVKLAELEQKQKKQQEKEKEKKEKEKKEKKKKK